MLGQGVWRRVVLLRDGYVDIDGRLITGEGGSERVQVFGIKVETTKTTRNVSISLLVV